ncbi:unnamed protein product, partial [marine sediment metagenome]
YLEQVDRFFPTKQKFAIITRQFPHNIGRWEPEAVGVEMKNYLDRGCIVMTYEEHAAGGYPGPYGQDEMWLLLLLGRNLYDARAPYTETVVFDRNLLTGHTGETYGWVEHTENDGGLYPPGPGPDPTPGPGDGGLVMTLGKLVIFVAGVQIFGEIIKETE